MVKLYHRKNEIAMDFTGLDSVGAIDIIYSGKMYAESMLPDDWQLIANKNRILCVSFGHSIPELLFNYTGSIKIKLVTVIDRELNKHPASVRVSGIDDWGSESGHFDQIKQQWSSLGSTHVREPGLLKTSIVKNNLLTKPDEFFLADGLPYEGEYHQHEDGQAMTGEEHSEESIGIYRKSRNGKIFNPRRRASRRDILKIMKRQKIKPFIYKERQTSADTENYNTTEKRKDKRTMTGGGGQGGSGY